MTHRSFCLIGQTLIELTPNMLQSVKIAKMDIPQMIYTDLLTMT